MSTLFTRTFLKGMADGMSDAGRMAPFADDDLAIGVFDKISTDLGLPQILEGPLPNDAYIKIGQWLIDASNEAVRRGYGPSASVQAMAKQASYMPLEERAMKIAAYMMAKTAEEASLNDTGPNTLESAAETNALADLDEENRSSLQYLVGAGNTDMPEGGVVGRQIPHPMAPKGPAIDNSLTHLDKQSSEKIARAVLFIQDLAAREAPVTPKLVLASAALAEGGLPGLETMTHIVENVKTAEELDNTLDHVLDKQQEHGVEPDPELVAAIEQVLADHGLIDEDYDDDSDDDSDYDSDDEAKVAAAKDVMKKIRSAARSASKAIRRAAIKTKNTLGTAASKVKRQAARAGTAVGRAAKRHGPGAAVGAILGAAGGAAAMHALHNRDVDQDVEEDVSEEAEKVARATMFVEGLANREAPVTPKLVLASAALAEAGTPGLEVMAHIMQNVKTAEELDNTIDDVLDAQEEHGAKPNTKLVSAVAQELADRGLIDEDNDYEPDENDDAKVAAAKDVMKKIRSAARSASKAIRRAAIKTKNTLGTTASKVKRQAARAGAAVGRAAKRHGPGAAVGAILGAAGGAAAMHALHNRGADQEEQEFDENEYEKEAQLLEVLKAAADGSLNEVDENTLEDAAEYNANAELDKENREPDEYITDNGETDMPNVGQVGALLNARNNKRVNFEEKVKAAAAKWGGLLPATMSQKEKRAHVIALAGMPEELRAGYIAQLRQE
jgi:hypothetical protein